MGLFDKKIKQLEQEEEKVKDEDLSLVHESVTDEEIARRTKLDVHSLGRNRVNVTLRNLDTFFDAFGIVDGDPMWRPVSERVIIW